MSDTIDQVQGMQMEHRKVLFPASAGITYHYDLIQGSDEWLAVRCGLLTASEMKLVVPPQPKVETRIKKDGGAYKQREGRAPDSEKCQQHLYELLGQRITGYVEPHYVGDDMLRGQDDEVEARALYAEHVAPVAEVGFITNRSFGFTLGYSPDGLVGDDGLIECKSRRQKFQIETIIEDAVPAEFMIQIQTGLLVTGRKWCDFISYCGGVHMLIVRVEPDPELQALILDAATYFEVRLLEKLEAYRARLASGSRLIPTERRIQLEMYTS